MFKFDCLSLLLLLLLSSAFTSISMVSAKPHLLAGAPVTYATAVAPAVATAPVYASYYPAYTTVPYYTAAYAAYAGYPYATLPAAAYYWRR